MANELIRLDIKSKNILTDIIESYSDLEMVLRGSLPHDRHRKPTYTNDHVMKVRAEGLLNIRNWLHDLQENVDAVSKDTEQILRTAGELRNMVDQSSNTNMEKLRRMGPAWIVPWPSEWKLHWEDLVMQKHVAEDCVESIKDLKERLTILSSNLVAFDANLVGAKNSHLRKSESLMSTEDLLAVLQNGVERGRDEIEQWRGFGY
jgi:hypothetical protein